MANTQHFRQAIQGNHTTQVSVWADLVDDLTALRNAHIALTAKLDADGDLTDTDFGSTTDPAALKTKE